MPSSESINRKICAYTHHMCIHTPYVHTHTICAYTTTYVHTCMHTYMTIYTPLHTHIHPKKCTQTPPNLRKCLPESASIHAHTHAHTFTCIYIHTWHICLDHYIHAYICTKDVGSYTSKSQHTQDEHTQDDACHRRHQYTCVQKHVHVHIHTHTYIHT